MVALLEIWCGGAKEVYTHSSRDRLVSLLCTIFSNGEGSIVAYSPDLGVAYVGVSA